MLFLGSSLLVFVHIPSVPVDISLYKYSCSGAVFLLAVNVR